MKEYIIRQIETKLEIREDEGKPKKIIGLIPYNKPSVDMGFTEIISPSAFTKTLNDKSDVIALFNHDSSQVLGRVSKNTLILSSSNEGLVCECILNPKVTHAMNLYYEIERGDVTTMSFGFEILQEDVERTSDGEVHTLKEVRLIEVSYGVANPAYPDTTSEARNIKLENIGTENYVSRAMQDLFGRRAVNTSTEAIDTKNLIKEALAKIYE